MADVSMKIIQHFGVISKNDKEWTKELNLVSWNNRAAKYDVREWSPDKKKSSKGITLREEETITLRELLNEMIFEGEYAEQPSEVDMESDCINRMEDV